MAQASGRAPDRLLFALAIACSAFLVFLVQPLVGKRLLPWYGGAPALWTVCLAFYQTTLFVGYAYAHLLRKLGRPRIELLVHATLFAAAWWVLPVLPGNAWHPESASDATGTILQALIANVALPFVFLSATGPLVQSWFARAHPARPPYFLYALSNLGSLLALFAYPVVIEPNLGLAATGERWSQGFAGVGVAVLCCGLVGLRRRDPAKAGVAASDVGGSARVGPANIALWLALPGVAVVLLMGITNQLCLDVASVPFLWVLPLGIYLLTFILCFASEFFYRRLAFFFAAAGALVLIPLADPNSESVAALRSLQSLPLSIALHAVLLFSACMVLHGELYRLRPPARALTAYYLWVSAGGALGGLFVGIGAERWFVDYYEVPLGIAAWCGLTLLLAMRDPRGPLGRGTPPWRKAVALGIALGLMLYMLQGSRYDLPYVIHQERSFFGVLRVRGAPDGSQRSLRHGTTLHGVQLVSEEGSRRPTTYYGVATGIGFAFRQVAAGPPARVGLVGLGVGTLAAYGREGDLYRFYEIDPLVISLARDSGYFSYLADSSARVEVVERDGRLALEEEQARGEAPWDVLVLDAFSSDSVPVHLLTREAVALYVERLAEHGLLAIHVSNRHLHLASICAKLAQDAGLSSLEVSTARAPRFTSMMARWVFIARDPARLHRLGESIRRLRANMRIEADAVSISAPSRIILEGTPVWTDDYSDLRSILLIPRTGRPRSGV